MYNINKFKNCIIFQLISRKTIKKTKILIVKINKKFKNKIFKIKNYKLKQKNRKF